MLSSRGYRICTRSSVGTVAGRGVAGCCGEQRPEISGLEILRAIEQQDYNVLRSRPAISKSRKAALLLRALTGKFLGRNPGHNTNGKAA